MKRKKKKNLFLYVVIILLLIVIVFLGMLLLKEDDSVLKNNDNNDVKVQDGNDYEDIQNSDVEEKEDNDQVTSQVLESNNKVVVYSRDEIFKKLSGIWRYVDSSGVNYAMRVYVDEVGADRVSIGIYGTGQGIFGKLTDVKHEGDSVYQLSLFSIGCDGSDCLEETEDATYYVDVDISNIDKNEVYVTINNNTNTYSYIADTWDEAESNFSY